ncbi:hypothetical protein BOX15_Mlig017751g1 [Macrostomum lignano]|uniref:Uncharacterized protein n=2 Tax=Macrostomum lignano TaxID=282301 RepID=A0A267EMA6_9PLAT|nr:hypothetical protein BOX15_Mlig017751g3 [Macrostomum lignano]PAA88974.1 hypothetical protein BOX15_Mlig017751g1 [Macrostomum lignano]
MGSTISHFYFVRSVLHFIGHVRRVVFLRPTLPQVVVSELVYQTHLDRDRVHHMFRVFISLAQANGRVTPEILSESLPGWSTNPLKSYLKRAIFNGSEAVTFPELVKRVALFCPESRFSPVVSELTQEEDASFFEGAASKNERFQRKRLLMLFDLANQRRNGQISCSELGRLIRCLLKTTIPDDTPMIIPQKVITEIAQVVIISVHERNEAHCWAVCRSKQREALLAEEEAVQGSHRMVITREMFLSELSRQDFA